MSGERPALSVVVAGGGTAGHIEPALAVADAVRALVPDARITALGTERGLETTLVPRRGYPLELIPPVPLPRKPTMDLLKLPAGSSRRCAAPGRSSTRSTPTSSSVSAGTWRCPPTSRPGPVRCVDAGVSRSSSTRPMPARASPIASVPCGPSVCSPPSRARESSGVATRRSWGSRSARRSPVSTAPGCARRHDGTSVCPTTPVLLVFGGSQGARSLNEAVSGASSALAEAGIAVLHAHGPKNTVDIPAHPGHARAPYVAVPYLERMDLAYSAADAVVCRSGAMTVAEVSAVGLPAVYVPLPHGNGEQELNARPVVEAGGGRIVADGDLSSDYVATEVVSLLGDERRLVEMGRSAAAAGHRSAADEMARIVLEVAGVEPNRSER